MTTLTRRAILAAAGWTIPVVTSCAAAPAFATSATLEPRAFRFPVKGGRGFTYDIVISASGVGAVFVDGRVAERQGESGTWLATPDAETGPLDALSVRVEFTNGASWEAAIPVAPGGGAR